MAEPPTPKRLFNIKNFTKGLIVVLEMAYLETAKIGQEYKLLNCDDHATFLSKKKRDPNAARPDISHQCLMTLLDSPLSKAGLLKIYVHTQANVLIDINPKLRIPRTFKRFSGLMVQLLHKLSIKAEGVRGEAVLKLVKGPVTNYFPPNTTVIGTSFSSSELVDINEFVPTLFESSNTTKKEKAETQEDDDEASEPKVKKIKTEKADSEDEAANDVKEEEEEEEEGSDEEGENAGSDEEGEGDDEEAAAEDAVEEPPQNFDVEDGFTFTEAHKKEDKVVVFVVGAMSHGKVTVDYVDKEISISQYPLSGSVACGKICCAFEKFYGII